MFWAIFVKKSFFFRVKFFTCKFFVEIIFKKVKNDFTRWKLGYYYQKSRNLELVGAEWRLIASNRVKKGYKYLNHFKFTYLIFRHVVCSVVFALETVMDKMPAKPSRILIGGALHVSTFTLWQYGLWSFQTGEGVQN